MFKSINKIDTEIYIEYVRDGVDKLIREKIISEEGIRKTIMQLLIMIK